MVNPFTLFKYCRIFTQFSKLVVTLCGMHECQSNDWQSTNKERAIKQVCKEAITVDFKDARFSSGLSQCAKLRTHAKESNLKTYVVSYLFMTSATSSDIFLSF